MKPFRPVITLLAALFVAVMGAVPASWSADAQPGPKAVIEDTINRIIDVLNARQDKSRLVEADRDAIRKIVTGRFDYEAMASRSLGQPWKELDAKERQHFTEVFRELLERSYGNRLGTYKGQTVTFGDVEIRGDKARILTTASDGVKNTPIEYRMHQTPTGWQVYDIIVEGASLVRTFYQDFQGQLEKGSYQELVKSLEDRIAKLKAQDSA
ncbi:MAG TPA: ABC transporter substrate-binding protein [Mariprofundaceae bacterium]|nr:ABC transporter substrate-binding protein [Mariprofundaceae bacterium]